MMSDLIDRDALMKEFTEFVRRSNNHDYAPAPTWNDAVSLVGSMPSAESERKKGQWWHYEGILTCSECGMEFYDDIEEYCGDDVPKFCPECGADMRCE